MNFTEAALLIQGSTCIYSKKVEYLYSLVFQVLSLLGSNKRWADHSNYIYIWIIVSPVCFVCCAVEDPMQCGFMMLLLRTLLIMWSFSVCELQGTNFESRLMAVTWMTCVITHLYGLCSMAILSPVSWLQRQFKIKMAKTVRSVKEQNKMLLSFTDFKCIMAKNGHLNGFAGMQHLFHCNVNPRISYWRWGIITSHVLNDQTSIWRPTADGSFRYWYWLAS